MAFSNSISVADQLSVDWETWSANATILQPCGSPKNSRVRAIAFQSRCLQSRWITRVY